MLRRVHNVFYWTGSMEEAVAFYRDTLGLDLQMRVEDDWAEFDVDGVRLALHGTRGAAAPQTGATVVFEVDDLDAAVRALRVKGVAFEGDVTEVPMSGRFASFRDPAGNVVQIFEPA
jgi:predicted enzyme related to lactoylglutathione lyase